MGAGWFGVKYYPVLIKGNEREREHTRFMTRMGIDLFHVEQKHYEQDGYHPQNLRGNHLHQYRDTIAPFLAHKGSDRATQTAQIRIAPS